MKFFINGFFSKCDQIRSFLRIWSHLLNKSLMENFIFYAVITSELFVLTEIQPYQLKYSAIGLEVVLLQVDLNQKRIPIQFPWAKLKSLFEQ